jgi:hypothetical protein
MRRVLFWATAVGLIFSSIAPVRADATGGKPIGDHKYVGAIKCKTCHAKELMGDQYGEWKKGPHAAAFEALKSSDAIEIGKKKGLAKAPHETEECLACHTTGHGLPATAFDKKPLNDKDGVQCESCHGPGSDYRKKQIMSSREKSIANGMWEPDKDETLCTACHNEKSPTWDPEKGFDYEKMKEKIAHPIPEDVKGHYLEIVKKRKAAGGAAADDEEDEE